MESVTAKFTKKIVLEMDNLITEGWYANRSEMIRDAVRRFLERRDRIRLEKAVDEDIRWGLHGE
ncbi:MAG: ribbon-helix-helix domain-containing protein [Thermoplasmatales archaeon]|nr:ribbon-helix-helix domain-containing protein [Thermoplasmatales archaeon]